MFAGVARGPFRKIAQRSLQFEGCALRASAKQQRAQTAYRWRRDARPSQSRIASPSRQHDHMLSTRLKFNRGSASKHVVKGRVVPALVNSNAGRERSRKPIIIDGEIAPSGNHDLLLEIGALTELDQSGPQLG